MTSFDKLSKLEKTLQNLTYAKKNRIERAFETNIRMVIDQAQIYIEECGVVVHDAEREKLVISGDQCILDCLQVVHNCIQLLTGVKGTGELLEKRLNEAFATATEDAEMLISLCKLPPNYKTVIADSSHMCHVGDCRQKFQNLPALGIHLVTIHELRQAVFGGFV